MVLICGLNTDVHTLPYYGAIEYIVKPRDIDVRMLQKTKIMQQCTEIYATFDVVDYIPSIYRCKLFLVKDIAELKERLLGQPQSDYMENLTKEAKNGKAITKIKNQPTTRRVVSADTNIQIAVPKGEVKTESAEIKQLMQTLQEKEALLHEKETMIESLNSIIESKDIAYTELEAEYNNLTTDTNKSDIATEQLEKLQKQNSLLQEQISDLQQQQIAYDSLVKTTDALNATISEKEEEIQCFKEKAQAYATQINELTAEKEQLMLQLTEMDAQLSVSALKENDVLNVLQEKCNALQQEIEHKDTVIAESEKTCNTYKSELETLKQSSTLSEILAPYLNTHTEISIAQFKDNEKEALKNLNLSNVHAICFTLGTAQCDGLRAVQTALRQGGDAIYIDCTGDVWLPSALHLQKKPDFLTDYTTPVKDMVLSFGNNSLLRTYLFNDIRLLTTDWVCVLRRIVEYAHGRTVYFIFGSMNSFAVRHTCLKLSQVLDVTLILHGDPHSAQSLYWTLINVPNDTISLGVYGYRPEIKSVLDSLVNRYKIVVSKDVTINYDTLVAQRKV